MNKFKIPFLIVLCITWWAPAVFAQNTTPNLGVVFSVPKTEKEIKIVIKNNTADVPIKVTTKISDAGGYSKKTEGIVDASGQQITQSFADLQPKHQYTVVISGVPVSGNGAGFGPMTYTLSTNSGKPDVVESLGGDGTNQTPGTIPDTPPTPDTNGQTGQTGNTQPNQTTVTTPGTTLTPEQVAADKEFTGLVPCTDTCDFNDILRLINKLIEFLITTLFIPIIILLFMYAGFKYITAEGNPSKVANLKKMVWHIIVGMLLVLCSWLIVKTLLSILSSNESGALQFLK